MNILWLVCVAYIKKLYLLTRCCLETSQKCERDRTDRQALSLHLMLLQCPALPGAWRTNRLWSLIPWWWCCTLGNAGGAQGRGSLNGCASRKKITEIRRENMHIHIKLRKRKGTARKRNVLLVLCLLRPLLHRPPPDPLAASLATSPSVPLSGSPVLGRSVTIRPLPRPP